METMRAVTDKMHEPSHDLSTSQKLGIAALGAIGLGAGAYGVNRLAKTVEDQTVNNQKARVKVTLPTKDPSDHETTIDAPISDFGFSARVYNDLGRDTRRRLRGELNERTMRRKKLPEAGPEDKQILKVSNSQSSQQQQQPTAPQVRTPWAMNYSQQQMPTPPPNPELVKQVEDAHAKIDQLSQKLQQKESTKAEAPAPAQGQTSFHSMDALNSRINTALKLVGASRIKTAGTTPSSPAHPAATPISVNELQYGHDLANRTFRGKPGIQTPFMPFTVPFGQTAHRVGTIARRAFMGSPQPSAAAQFMEDQPPSNNWQQQLMALAPSIVQSYAQ
jgi:hypothetical protein